MQLNVTKNIKSLQHCHACNETMEYDSQQRQGMGPYHVPNKQSAWNNSTRNKNGGTEKSTKDLNFSNIIGL